MTQLKATGVTLSSIMVHDACPDGIRIPSSFGKYKILSSKKLNPVEKEIIGLVCGYQEQDLPTNLSTRDIARKLGTSKATVARSISTLLGNQSKKDKKMGILRPQLLRAKCTYWHCKGKRKTIKKRTLILNQDLFHKSLVEHLKQKDFRPYI